MTTRIRTLTLFAALVLGLALPAHAQLYVLSNTTLNGAINASQTTLVLASASASAAATVGAPAAGQCLFIDQELMRIVSMAGTTATVTRASSGAVGHPTGRVIFTGPCNDFRQTDPPVFQAGTPTTSTTQVNCSNQPGPWINVSNGNVWWCNTVTNNWTATNYRTITYNSVAVTQ